MKSSTFFKDGHSSHFKVLRQTKHTCPIDKHLESSQPTFAQKIWIPAVAPLICLPLSLPHMEHPLHQRGAFWNHRELCHFCLSDPVASVRRYLGWEDGHRAGWEGDDHGPRGPAGDGTVAFPAAQPREQQGHLRHCGGSRASAKAQTGVGAGVARCGAGSPTGEVTRLRGGVTHWRESYVSWSHMWGWVTHRWVYSLSGVLPWAGHTHTSSEVTHQLRSRSRWGCPSDGVTSLGGCPAKEWDCTLGVPQSFFYFILLDYS